jgi:hypothetical protein
MDAAGEALPIEAVAGRLLQLASQAPVAPRAAAPVAAP